MLEWGNIDERYFHHGCDRGVLYPDGLDPVVWNGITGVNESGNGSSTVYYIDGQIYLADMDPTDFSGSLTAFDFPDEFAACIGMPLVAEGLQLDNQKPKRFGLSYRTLVGSGATGDTFGYQIHLIYKCMASIASRQRRTVNNSPAPMEFSFDLVATPVRVLGFRPTAHFVIDTRYLTPDSVAELEGILYGDGVTPGALPDPTALYEMLNFGEAIEVTHDLSTGILTIKGKAANVFLTSADTYQINNVNSTAPDPNGEYVISDGGNTDVIEV